MGQAEDTVRERAPEPQDTRYQMILRSSANDYPLARVMIVICLSLPKRVTRATPVGSEFGPATWSGAIPGLTDQLVRPYPRAPTSLSPTTGIP